MGKTQKVEAVGLSLAALASVFLRLPPELNQACLLRVKFQPKAGQPFPKLAHKPFPIFPAIESYNEIIGKPHHDHIPACFAPPPLSNPKIERIVQIDIGQKRTNDSTHAIANFEFERVVSYQRTWNNS
jgi:hypothetical protein